jgi:hypothetical protein
MPRGAKFLNTGLTNIQIRRNKTEYILIEYDFEGRYQEVEGTRKPMKISGDVIGDFEKL